METHRIIVETLARSESQKERSILPKIELEAQTQEPQHLTYWINDQDNLENIPIIPSTLNYLIIRATYTQDDTQAGVQAGDLAPFHVRVDGDTQDRARKGLYVLTGDVTSLEVGTPVTNGKVELKVLMG